MSEFQGAFGPLYWGVIAAMVLVLAVLGAMTLLDRKALNKAKHLPIKLRQINRLKIVKHLAEGRRHQDTGSHIQRMLGMKPPVFRDTIDYLVDSGLVRISNHWLLPTWWPSDTRVFSLTSKGQDEFDFGRSHPNQETSNLAPQVLIMEIAGVDMSINQYGKGNTASTGGGTTQGGINADNSRDRNESDPEVIRKFVDDYKRLFTDSRFDASNKRRAEDQLRVIEDELGEQRPDRATIASAARRALDIAGAVGIGVAGDAAFQGLESIWRTFGGS